MVGVLPIISTNIKRRKTGLSKLKQWKSEQVGDHGNLLQPPIISVKIQELMDSCMKMPI